MGRGARAALSGRPQTPLLRKIYQVQKEDSERYTRHSRRHGSMSDDDERMSVGSKNSQRLDDRIDRDFLEKGTSRASALSTATLTSLGGTSSCRGSEESSITADSDASVREIKEIHELKDQIQDVEAKYMQSLKEVKDLLAEMEEKYRKAMVSNAQLDNEKSNLMYQVDTLKDSLMELEELLSETRREFEEKSKDLEREKHAHSILQFQFSELKETLKQSEEFLTKHGIVLGPDLNTNGEVGEGATGSAEVQEGSSVLGTEEMQLSRRESVEGYRGQVQHPKNLDLENEENLPPHSCDVSSEPPVKTQNDDYVGKSLTEDLQQSCDVENIQSVVDTDDVMSASELKEKLKRGEESVEKESECKVGGLEGPVLVDQHESPVSVQISEGISDANPGCKNDIYEVPLVSSEDHQQPHDTLVGDTQDQKTSGEPSTKIAQKIQSSSTGGKKKRKKRKNKKQKCDENEGNTEFGDKNEKELKEYCDPELKTECNPEDLSLTGEKISEQVTNHLNIDRNSEPVDGAELRTDASGGTTESVFHCVSSPDSTSNVKAGFEISSDLHNDSQIITAYIKTTCENLMEFKPSAECNAESEMINNTDDTFALKDSTVIEGQCTHPSNLIGSCAKMETSLEVDSEIEMTPDAKHLLEPQADGQIIDLNKTEVLCHEEETTNDPLQEVKDEKETQQEQMVPAGIEDVQNDGHQCLMSPSDLTVDTPHTNHTSDEISTENSLRDEHCQVITAEQLHGVDSECQGPTHAVAEPKIELDEAEFVHGADLETSSHGVPQCLAVETIKEVNGSKENVQEKIMVQPESKTDDACTVNQNSHEPLDAQDTDTNQELQMDEPEAETVKRDHQTPVETEQLVVTDEQNVHQQQDMPENDEHTSEEQEKKDIEHSAEEEHGHEVTKNTECHVEVAQELPGISQEPHLQMMELGQEAITSNAQSESQDVEEQRDEEFGINKEDSSRDSKSENQKGKGKNKEDCKMA